MFRGLILMGALLIMAASFIGCDSSMEGYRVFTFNEVAHFSFEYPAHYKITSAHGTVEDRTIYIGLRDKILPEGRTNGFIYLYVEGAGDTYRDAGAALENEIWQFVRAGHLIEHSAITVDKMPAELLVYSREPDLIPEAPASSLEVMKVTRSVYFDYDGFIWNLVIESDEDRVEEAEADFEHLLETFQILD